MVPENQAEPTPASEPTLNPSEVGALLTMAKGGPIPSGEVDHNQEVISHEDLIEDAKFYQDVALNYQNAYEVLLAQQAELQD